MKTKTTRGRVVFRLFSIFSIFCIAVLTAPALAQDEVEGSALVEAISAAGAQNWERVDALRPRLRDGISRDLVDWHRLRGRQGDFAECKDFIARNETWPGMPLLRLRCEYTIPRGEDPARVLRYFSEGLPQTGTGSLRLAEALIRTGKGPEAAQVLRRAWLEFNLSGPEHDAFVERNGKTVEALHEARLDRVLWRDADRAVERMLPLVSEDWQKLAAARSGLRANRAGVDALIEAVPEALRNDPGLQYERFVWRHRKGRTEGALEIILAQSTSAEELGQPEEWANRRRQLARELMRAGNWAQAYAVASSHFLESGSNFADLEWLSGFIALRGLDAPEEALAHFERFQGAVETPISLGRAGYWLGRAHEEMGDAEAAKRAYAFGGKYQSSFYGQLAADRGGVAPDPLMTGTESFPPLAEATFTGSRVFQAAMLLQRAGLRDLSERFFVHLGESLTRPELGQLGALALELDEPHIALRVAKQAARLGHEIYPSYFPVSMPAGLDLPVAEEFALAIARRESEFDAVVVSPAGARGLMQLMPGTAQEVAGSLETEYSRSRLLTDPVYNATLGGAYLANLAARYDNNPVLMSVAYNAGPSRADRWQRVFGDPRAREIDIIDWIEKIPFRETRNYVMRVTESFMPYRARLTGRVGGHQLLTDLKR